MFAPDLTLDAAREPKRLYDPFLRKIRAMGVFPVSPTNDGSEWSQKRSVKNTGGSMLQLTVNTGQTSFHRASGSLAVSEPLTAYLQLCQYVSWWSLIFGKNFRAYMRAPARVYMRVRGCACARMIFSFIFADQ